MCETKKIVFFLAAIGSRIYLVFLGDYMDNCEDTLRYTDTDYDVFSDAATHVRNGFGSPYARKTYRYTPLAAYMCVVNNYYHPAACKLVFCALDIIATAVFWSIIELQYKAAIPQGKTRVLAYVYAWALNPITVNLSTRGSNDNIITLLVMLSVLLLLRKWYFLAGLFYGFSIHFKIFPIIYCFVFYFFIDCDKELIAKGHPYKAIISKKGFFTWNRIVFTLSTIFSLAAFTGVFYYIYGWEFLWEANLYHLTRKDHRHNYSVYWYLIYQVFDEQKSNILAVTMFIPQAMTVVASGFLFYYDIFFAMLLQTWNFVNFNKVMTVQYYLWYMSLMPLTAMNNT